MRRSSKSERDRRFIPITYFHSLDHWLHPMEDVRINYEDRGIEATGIRKMEHPRSVERQSETTSITDVADEVRWIHRWIIIHCAFQKRLLQRMKHPPGAFNVWEHKSLLPITGSRKDWGGEISNGMNPG